MMHPVAALIVKHPAIIEMAAKKPYTHDESNIGVWIWVAYLVLANVLWIIPDVWLWINHHEMMTTEYREGLKGTWQGPLLSFLTWGTFAAFIYHMYFSTNAGQGG